MIIVPTFKNTWPIFSRFQKSNYNKQFKNISNEKSKCVFFQLLIPLIIVYT